jgi:hypothetical protein
MIIKFSANPEANDPDGEWRSPSDSNERFHPSNSATAVHWTFKTINLLIALIDF